MEFAVDTFTIGIDQFEGVRAVAIHVTVAIRQTSIAEQERHLHRRQDKTMKTTTRVSVPITVNDDYKYKDSEQQCTERLNYLKIFFILNVYFRNTSGDMT